MSHMMVGMTGQAMAGDVRWSKVLYLKQGFPDDFVPDTFLKDLRKNVNVRNYSLCETIIASVRLSDQVAFVILLLVLFSCLSSDGPLSPTTATAAVVCVSIFLFVTFLLMADEGQGWNFTRSTLICLLGGFIVSPILKTLTESISTDTVYAMVTLMILLHVIFFDYGIESAIVSPPISLNAALFGAVCLASRLSTISAFTLLIFAADIFVLVSLIRTQLEQKFSRRSRTCLSAAVVLISVAATWTRSVMVRSSYLILLFFLNLVFPFCFFKLQNMKENIYGPWDEAIIRR